MNAALPRETIFALSSGQPPAAIAVMRLSGPQAGSVLARLAGKLPEPRRARLALLRDPMTGLELDKALILFFPGPNSVTGEDLAELHLHGGRAVVAAVERVLAAIPGLRRAEAGEFTRRAFESGRLDLAEAEGLADLLAAETESQRRNAMALADGSLSRAVRRWRGALTSAAAAIEARIDFADEDDVPDDDGRAQAQLVPILAEIEGFLRAPPAERLKDGIKVALGGPTNAGKSSLFNELIGKEAAIATPIAGTTRDLIEYPVQIGGVPFVFIDTAGLRDTADVVEQIGVDRAQMAINSADILLWLGSVDTCPRGDAILLYSRSDILERAEPEDVRQIRVSTVTGEGLEQLIQELVSRGTSLLPREGEVALARRQRDALEDCAASLRAASGTTDILIIAESLRGARAALDRLTGEGGVEPLLDAIFGQFCIGK